jgi:hypothetical protein
MNYRIVQDVQGLIVLTSLPTQLGKQMFGKKRGCGFVERNYIFKQASGSCSHNAPTIARRFGQTNKRSKRNKQNKQSKNKQTKQNHQNKQNKQKQTKQHKQNHQNKNK